MKSIRHITTIAALLILPLSLTACSRAANSDKEAAAQPVPASETDTSIGDTPIAETAARPMPAIFVKGFDRQRIVWPMPK